MLEFLFGDWKSLIPEVTLADPKADHRLSKRAGQYRVSDKAIYLPDNTYLPLSAVTNVVHDQSSVHVSGCCAGGVPVERLVLDTPIGRKPFLFDSVKEAERVEQSIRAAMGQD